MTVGIAEIQALRDYLHSTPASTLQRGKRYYRQRRVLSCLFDSENGTLKGRVRGNLDYQAILSYDPNRKRWEGECSCPVTFDCKHCIALAYYLLEHRQDVPTSGKQSGEKPTITPEEQAALDELTAYWERKNGKPPTPTQTKHLARIAECYLLWKSGNLSDTFLVDHLSPILRLGASYYYHRSLELPERIDPPLSVIEFWHAVLERAFLAEFSLSKPKQWQAISDIEESREALDRLEREEERLMVQNWLAEFAENPEFLELPNEIQIRIGKRQAVVFVTVPGNRKPQRITSTQWTELQANPSIDPAGQILLTLLKDHVANRGVVELENDYAQSRDALRRLLCLSDARPALRQWNGEPLDWPEEEATWTLERADDYDRIRLSAGGQWLHPIDLFLPGHPSLAVCDGKVYRTAPAPAPWHHPMEEDYEVPLPAGTLCSPGGRKLCRMLKIPFPEDYQAQIRIRSWQVEIQAEMKYSGYGHEAIALNCQATASADQPGKAAPAPARFTPHGWVLPPDPESLPGEGFIENEWNGAADLDRLMAGMRPRFDHHSAHWELPCREDTIAQLAEWATSCSQARVLARGELAALLKPPAHVRLEVEIEESGRDWFDVEARLNCEEEDLTEEEMALLMKGKGRWVRIPRKGWRRMEAIDTETWDDSLAELGITLGNENHTRQRLHALQLAPAAEKDFLDPADARQIRKRVNAIRTQVDIDVPETIRADLRPYQREGLNFLAYLSTNNFGGILADDMGLGKTLQSLAWLAWLQRRRGKAALPGPTLVVCPKSVVDNWVAEAAKFFPKLKAIPVTSAVDDSVIEEADRKALVVMNYAQLRSRRDTLLEREWGAVILDEGQFIKNPASQTARTAFELQSTHRLVLTGTPVENRLTDLWSLMNFAMPGILGNKQSFKTLAGDGSDPIALRRVGIRLKPFFLRRTKKAVAADLPERIEEDILCHLSGEQKKHYDAELKKARLILAKVRSASDFNEARFNILTSLLRLRQLCCHRALVEGTRDPARVKPSPKLDALGDLLDPLRAEGEKVLIFSQFTSLLDIVAPFVEKQGSPVWTLTGKTNRRQKLVDDFRASDGHAVFLISLKAGGTGLNLTEAPYVVMLDPWWNPAVENQAIDRTHRIGQTRNVIAYRILARDTIEEKIRQLQQDKSRLAESVLGEASGGSALTLDDFRFLLD